eukprot:TRINITY_DN1193_c1_g1_i1.p2 TRINITY_DN1193_c1_g1~~TRINITY_DN1193_c1_g1_i1.p2  ORF type:complete len:193 (-),score=23.52 TRINITY_DN1193_c1_g1_i1:502-1080(-)
MGISCPRSLNHAEASVAPTCVLWQPALTFRTPRSCATLVGPCVGKGTDEAVSLNGSMYSSGGGFSGLYDLLTWQADVVKAYLASGVKLPPSEMWHAQGGVPDVAAVGGQNLVVTDRVVQQGGGTSASSPLWPEYGLMNSTSFKKTGKPLGPICTVCMLKYHSASRTSRLATIQARQRLSTTAASAMGQGLGA